jgi:signal peptidase I
MEDTMDVKSFVRNHLSTITLIVLLVAFRWSFADHYRVPSGSMLPTIEIGDHLLTNKMAYDLKVPFTDQVVWTLSEPQQGDVVVFKYPQDESVLFVKRVIALPRQKLSITRGHVFIDGKRLNETYLPSEIQGFTEGEFEITVPDDMYFVMGDNRLNSSDSRVWGFVPRRNIKGKATRVLWNIEFNSLVPRMRLERIANVI